WADKAKLVVGKRETIPATAGEFACIKRVWKNGDKVKLTLPMDIRGERRYHDSIAIHRGPLVFSLEIGQYMTRVKKHSDIYPDASDWEIRPSDDWNYALLLNPEKLQSAFKVKKHPVSPIPFATTAAPVVLSVKACQLDEWVLDWNSAGDLPQSPIDPKGLETKTVKLIPYGCTQLRISEFPLAEKK
ncbi:MAG: glycoside hydrolase family 127 protein, partial [Verrucomicrobia bacterium]|nr:glycoside hydrolase family 127 protein [Verrucomicrobiota bacterium]